MNFDVFEALTQPGSNVTLHNVQLLDVHPSEDGHERLSIVHAGISRELWGGLWGEQSRRSVGLIGCVLAASSFGGLPAGSCYFRPYLDQSLRRVPELDIPYHLVREDGPEQAVFGWCCDAKPGGFRAPAGIIPGEEGQFVPDETVEVKIRVPSEFVRECLQVQMTPGELLRSFVGDLAGIQNFSACPRADGYGSNGSDERDCAEAWLLRAHGHNAIDLDAVENQALEDEERQWQRDEFADMLDAYERAGGEADNLFAAVQELLDKQSGS